MPVHFSTGEPNDSKSCFLESAAPASFCVLVCTVAEADTVRLCWEKLVTAENMGVWDATPTLTQSPVSEAGVGNSTKVFCKPKCIKFKKVSFAKNEVWAQSVFVIALKTTGAN